MIKRMGGLYHSFRDISLNPLDVREDTPQTRQRVTLILRAMLGPEPLTAEENEAVAAAIHRTLSLGAETRTFNAIYPSAFAQGSQLRRRLAPWVTDEKNTEGLYAHIFNAPRDTLAGLLDQAFLLGINMNEVLKDEILGPPVIAHMAETIRAAAVQGGQNGFAIFVDEAANFLQNEQFGKFVSVMFREYRKLNGIVGLAFQDPGALTRSSFAEAIIENTATMIFYPNPQGNPDSYAPFRLNAEEMGFVLGEHYAEAKRPVLVVRRDAATNVSESVMIDADLSPLGPEIMVGYRSGVDANRELASPHLQAEEGS